MPNVRDIRRRIKSVKSTAQITRAMQMVAASKMRKAQLAAIAGRPYAVAMNEVLSQVALHGGTIQHPLMTERPVQRRGVLLVSTDRGLCGGLNGNLFREVLGYPTDTTFFVGVGKKAAQFLHRTHRSMMAEFSYHDTPLFADARTICSFISDLFLKGDVDAVDIVYTDFISTMVQKPKVCPFLPVGQLNVMSVDMDGHRDDSKLAVEAEHLRLSDAAEFLFEPSANSVYGALIPHSLNFRLYHILLEAKASEHSARMVAMKTATDNAAELIKDLTLEYNKMRQANITRELLEITSAAMSAEG